MDFATSSVRAIKQKDNHTFTIVWSDGSSDDYRLSQVQRECPCANCRDEMTGKQLVDKNTIDEYVRAKRITNIGRYGLRIEFTSGCSTGIFGFDFLRKIAGHSP